MGVILKLWPIFLFAIGVDLIIARRSVWGAINSIILLIIILAGSMSHILPDYQTTGNIQISPGDSSSENRVYLTISQAIGLVKIEVESE